MQPTFVVPSPVRRSICSREFWTARKCYRLSIMFGFMALVLLIILGVLMVSPAIDGLSLKPATCTVIRTEMGKVKSCNCGKYCSSSYPCLKIYVNYVPNDKQAGGKNTTNQILHDTVYENNDDRECSVAPCQKIAQSNYDDVRRFKDSKGVVGQSYTCFYNSKKTSEVVANTSDFKATILHCILWPMVMILICIGWVLLIYYRRHTCCAPNDGQNLNLIWE